jgi:hypothetical protein
MVSSRESIHRGWWPRRTYTAQRDRGKFGVFTRARSGERFLTTSIPFATVAGMTGIDPQSAAVRRLVVKLLLNHIDATGETSSVISEIREEGIDTTVAVLSDVAELAATSFVRLHGVDEARATLNRLIVADLEEEASTFDQ